MDPRHVQDFNSMRQYGYEPGPISPDFGIEITNALNAQHGRGWQKKLKNLLSLAFASNQMTFF